MQRSTRSFTKKSLSSIKFKNTPTKKVKTFKLKKSGSSNLDIFNMSIYIKKLFKKLIF